MKYFCMMLGVIGCTLASIFVSQDHRVPVYLFAIFMALVAIFLTLNDEEINGF